MNWWQFMKYLIKILILISLFVSFCNSSDKTEHIIKKIILTGTYPQETCTLKSILDSYSGKNITYKTVRDIKKKLEKYYKKDGYLLVKVIIPKQEIKNGFLKFYVNVGKVGDIRIEGEKYYSEEFVKSHFKLQKGDFLNYTKMMKYLLLLNEYDNLNVKSFLKKSKIDNSSDITLKVEDSKPVKLGFWYDNLGSKTTSKNRLGTNFGYGNFLAEGDKIELTPVFSFAPSKTKFISSNYIVPLYKSNVKFNMGFVYANYLAAGDFSDLGAEGDTYVYRFGFDFPILRDITTKFDLSLNYTKKDAKNYLLGSISSKEKIDLISCMFNWQYQNLTNNLGLTMELTKGSTNEGSILGRVDESKDYKKANLFLSLTKKLNDDIDLIGRFNSQYTKEKLPSTEMFSIGGLNSVRGFDSGFLPGDSGFYTSIEGLYKIKYKKVSNLKVGLFLDYGRVWINAPVAGENRCSYIFGGGVESFIEINKNYSFRLTMGYPITSSNDDYDRGINLYLTANAKIW